MRNQNQRSGTVVAAGLLSLRHLHITNGIHSKTNGTMVFRETWPRLTRMGSTVEHNTAIDACSSKSGYGMETSMTQP